MTFKPSKRFIRIGALLIALTAILMVAVIFILTTYLQSRLLPRIAADFGLKVEELKIRRMGLWGADLGPIRISAAGAPVVKLAAVQVDYSPWSLMQGRIKSLTLGGMDLSIAVGPDGLSIAGLPTSIKTNAPSDAGDRPNLEALFPIPLDHLAILQSRVNVDWKGRRFNIPCDIRIETVGAGRRVLRGRAELSILGHPVIFSAALDQSANTVSLDVECKRFLFASLCRTGVLPGDVRLSGTLDLNGRVRLQADPLKISDLAITIGLTETRLATPYGNLENTDAGNGDSRIMTLSVTARDPDRIMFTCSPFQYNGSLKTVVASLTGELVKGTTGWALKAQTESRIPPQVLAGGLQWEKDLPMHWDLDASQGDGGTVNFKIQTSESLPVTVGANPYMATVKKYRLDIGGQYVGGRAKVGGALSAGELEIAMPEGTVAVTDAKISGDLAIASATDAAQAELKGQAVLSGIRSEMGSTMFTVPKVQFKVSGQAGPDAPLKFQGLMSVSDGHVRDKVHGVALQGFSLNLPLMWPYADKAPSGRLDVQAVQWKGRELGGARGSLMQKNQSFEADLEHRSKLFKGLLVLVKSRLTSAGIHADVRIPSYAPDKSIDLGRFLPAAAGIMAGGRMEAESALDIVDGSIRGRAGIKITDATVTRDEQKLSLEGITMGLQIDDIAAMKSAPRQNLKVESLRFGNLAARNLDVDFQLEDHKTLFLEKLGLQWCQGRVNTAAVRITSGKEDYDVTLFCDRLNLAMVLEQLGAAQAGGQGTVNGRIPLHWVNGRLSFDNGFLYSTPGQDGQIQVTGTEDLLAGMPPDSPQYTQLDIATEALKDYTYKWAKLSVQSEKDVLLLKLQFDGKPNRLLPFAYDQKLGRFQRVSGEGQAEFKGISIDLNFKSPLNEIIHYKELLNRN